MGCIFSILVIALAIVLMMNIPDSQKYEPELVAHKIVATGEDVAYITANTFQKANVYLNLDGNLVYATKVVIECYKEVVGKYFKPTITSANDSEHTVNSKHYSNKAVDFRIKDVPREDRELLYNRIKQKLPDFTVLWEDVGTYNEHLHIQY